MCKSKWLDRKRKGWTSCLPKCIWTCKKLWIVLSKINIIFCNITRPYLKITILTHYPNLQPAHIATSTFIACHENVRLTDSSYSFYWWNVAGSSYMLVHWALGLTKLFSFLRFVSFQKNVFSCVHVVLVALHINILLIFKILIIHLSLIGGKRSSQDKTRIQPRCLDSWGYFINRRTPPWDWLRWCLPWFKSIFVR